MGLFNRSKKPRPTPGCQLCGAQATMLGEGRDHWAEHAIQIPDGRWIFRCACGEEDGAWQERQLAGMGLADHHLKKHGIQLQ